MLLRRPRGVYREALERTSALPGCVGAAATLELHAARFFPTLVERLLSVALHDSVAMPLDSSLDVASGLFPVADAIDVWARDPPHNSVLGCPA